MIPKFSETKGEPLICPSILSCDFANIAGELTRVAEGTDVFHCDIMDGHAVPNLTFGPPVIKAIRRITDIPLDVHMMVDTPENWVEMFAEAGADSLTFHAESTLHGHRLAHQIKNCGMNAGVSLNPGTPLQAVEELLPFVDIVLVMTVNPGFGGQRFIEQMLGKVERLQQIRTAKGYDFHIEVDGGINADTVEAAVAAGADMLVAGNAIFGADEPLAAAYRLRELAISSYRDNLIDL